MTRINQCNKRKPNMKSMLFLFGIACSCAISALPTELYLELGLGERISLPLAFNQIVCISDDDNLALVHLAYEKQGECRYEYRLFDLATRKEKSGSGRVFEAYVRHPRENGDFELEDIGSELTIKAGDLSIDWSYGDKNGCFLYYEPGSLNVEIMNAAYFRAATLKHLQNNRVPN